MPSTTSKNLGQVAASLASATAPTNTNLIWLDISGPITIKKIWDPIAQTWSPLTQAGTVAGDNWGTQVVVKDTTLAGTGVTSDPLGIARQGATTGQVLKYNGTTWAPANENPGGLTSISHNDSLIGDGSVGQPLGIVTGTAINQVITWNGTKWVPAPPQLGAIFTAGMIMMWSGSPTSVPVGWLLCDGSLGTPNLAGMFIVGYNVNDGDYNQIGRTGGAKTVQLNSDQNGPHTHGVNDPGHTHGVTLGTDVKGGAQGVPVLSTINQRTNFNTITGSNVTGISLQGSGGGSPHENRPNYYTLAYIIKQ